MRDYGKVHTSFWTSSNIREMSEDGRTLAMYLLTCPHGTIAGIFRLPDGYACEDLQWTSERVKQGFIELFRNGFANRCETTKWVWITKHFEWNPPENPNQKKAVAKVAAQVPDDCTWKPDFMRDCGLFFGLIQPPKDNPSETLQEPFLNQEQEQEQEQYQETPTTSSPSQAKDDPLQCPVEKIIEAYHELMPDNPRCKVLNQARRSAIKARWLEASRLTCKPFGYATREGGLAAWRSFFETCAESPFLTGKAKPSLGKPPFFADVDFLFSPSGFARCLENKYHREAA